LQVAKINPTLLSIGLNLFIIIL